MINKEKILEELELAFSKFRKEFAFNVNFEELDKEFFIKDSVLSTGFISPEFSRQVCSRIVESYRDWHGYLNNLLLPNPSYYAGQTESKLFSSEEDKRKIWNLVELSMKFSSAHSLNMLKSNKELISKFIDEGYLTWVNTFKPRLIYILDKVNEGWKKE
ncbi:hypothetical protein COU58_01640 [Candidatus Pacearchaeota archaeon CG10_big_fil_rev_8_21_14_0_10_32_42]|nr:MAG: hypothetical protein COU58_01640 [Candidatus Pacearchaeota archaeon CG10_big_fil_rev_8_21_14_0_10_32_42]